MLLLIRLVPLTIFPHLSGHDKALSKSRLNSNSLVTCCNNSDVLLQIGRIQANATEKSPCHCSLDRRELNLCTGNYLSYVYTLVSSGRCLLLTSQKQETPSSTEPEKGSGKLEKLKKNCNQHESRLLPGVVDPQNIKVGKTQTRIDFPKNGPLMKKRKSKINHGSDQNQVGQPSMQNRRS